MEMKPEASGSDFDPDKERKLVYRHGIVYGTISNFAADILREEFEQKQVRCGRRFDAVIADEVDLLMLDEGVQLTYLSHNAAVLHHLEPVLASVWCVVGQYRLTTTEYGKFLYAGTPKLFSESIFESINPDNCNLKDPVQILHIAYQAKLISDQCLNLLLDGKDQTSKLEAMNTIDIKIIIDVLQELEEYIPYMFKPYTINAEGTLTAAIKDVELEGQDMIEVKILVLQNGMACSLSTVDELKYGAMAKVEHSLSFSDEIHDDSRKAEVKLPKFLKDLVSNQLPVFIDSALRCLQMTENREYTIKEGKIIPVDYQNSGIMETNKKWGSGLQQMLEMKHNLSLSSMSVVTNFMSHIELFRRYKEKGAIFGLSGTLGLDSAVTANVLCDLFQVFVCSIPTHKRRKLYEKPPCIVPGEYAAWIARIMDAIKEAVKPEPWKKGRAVLVLCEDIKTASELNTHIHQERSIRKKPRLYAHSSSEDEIKSINEHYFDSGEIIIATNLAGRGTDIKITEEVNRSGGLFCIVTFLPRNRRVELQAFGRTGRKGESGSVQCILRASSLPPHFQELSLSEIRDLRAKKEQVRLNRLIQSDVKEVQLKETLFKKHCKVLQQIHKLVHSRDDKQVIFDSLNESWGQWLLMKGEQIEALDEETLIHELSQAHRQWKPVIPYITTDPVHLPVTNFYHFIKFGNRLLVTQEKMSMQRALEYYDASIAEEPKYAAIAHYNRAYCTINMMNEGYIADAIRDLEAADKCLNPYICELTNVLQCVTFVNQTRQPGAVPNESTANGLQTQMQVRLQILGYIRKKVQENIKKLKDFKGKDDVIANALGVFSLIPDADYQTHQELCTMWSLGMEVVFSVEKKPRFCWEGLLVCLLGVAEILAGVALTAFTVGTAASIGMALISEGISDCIDGIEAMVTGEFSWAEWGISKATGLAVSLVSGGIGRFASKGMKVFKLGSNLRKLGRQLKPVTKLRQTWGLAAKQNLRSVAKYVGKEVAQEAIMYGVRYGENKLFEHLTEQIGNELKDEIERDLKDAFTKGELGKAVDELFIQRLPDCYIEDDKMSPGLQQEAFDFFRNVGDATVSILTSDSTIQKHITSASLSLFSQLSEKHKAHKRKYQAAEIAVMGVSLAKAKKDMRDLASRFIPQAETTCAKFKKEELSASPVEYNRRKARYQQLTCVKSLKERLAQKMGDIFSKAVAAVLQQNLGAVVNHGLGRTVNRVAKNTFSRHVKFLRTDRVLENIKSGQYTTSFTSVKLSHSDHASTKMVGHYAKKVADVNYPGSLLELRAAVEHYGHGVTIYQKKNGKLVRDCSIEPSSGQQKTSRNIELVYTPPADHHSPGHYDLVGKKIHSDANNCLFQAFAVGCNPTLSPHAQREKAQEVRHKVADHMKKNPNLWNDHILQRKELDKVRQGNYFSRFGAGDKNESSKILQGCFQEHIHENELHTRYLQANGIKCRSIRSYEDGIQVHDGNVVSVHGSKDIKLRSMKVFMEGLNFNTNIGRCWDTKPVMGQIKRHQGDRNETEVAFHICPSEGGACAGDAYANAVMASPHYNKMERYVWSEDMRTHIGERDFKMFVEITTGPVVPKDPNTFFREMNEARVHPEKYFQAYKYKDGGETEQLNQNAQKVLLKRLQLIQDKHPTAYRVESLTFNIINHDGEVKKVKMPKDYELFASQDTIQQERAQKGHEITRSKSKNVYQKFNQEPKYRSPLTATEEDMKTFTNLKKAEMIRGLADIPEHTLSQPNALVPQARGVRERSPRRVPRDVEQALSKGKGKGKGKGPLNT